MLAELKVSSSHSKMLPSLELYEKQFLNILLTNFFWILINWRPSIHLFVSRQSSALYCLEDKYWVNFARRGKGALGALLFILIVRFLLNLLCISFTCFLFQLFPGVHVFCFGQFSWQLFYWRVLPLSTKFSSCSLKSIFEESIHCKLIYSIFSDRYV